MEKQRISISKYSLYEWKFFKSLCLMSMSRDIQSTYSPSLPCLASLQAACCSSP